VPCAFELTHARTHIVDKTLRDLSLPFLDMPELHADLQHEYFKIVKDNFLNIFFSFSDMLLK
jgi:hypothetical protein